MSLSRHRSALLLAVIAAMLWGNRALAAPGAQAAQDARTLELFDQQPQKLVEVADSMAADPYGKDFDQNMRRLIRYRTQTKKLKVMVSLNFVQPLLEPPKDSKTPDAQASSKPKAPAPPNKEGLKLMALYEAGLLKYAVQHDGVADVSDEPVTAALHHMLQGYRNMVSAKPDARNQTAERLLKLDAAGQLSTYLDERRQQGK